MTAGMGIYDAMQFVEAPGWDGVYGFGSEYGNIFVNRGRRRDCPCRTQNYDSPTLGGASGQAVDVEIQAKEMMHHKGRLNQLMAFTRDKQWRRWLNTDRDRYMSPLEAKNYGLIDEVIGGILG